MVFLRAFTDDSGSEARDRRLFMAGYVNRADQWALFSDAWHEECRTAPSIEYLKMSEAQNLGGQFRGWSQKDRDEKLRGLARVIRHFQPMSFEFSIHREEYDRVVAPVSPRGLKNAHFVGCIAVVSGVSRYLANEGGRIPIEFVFDQQDGVSDTIDLSFDQIKRNIPRRARKLIKGKPRFEDDKQLLPLQAADFLVWHLRREHEDHITLEMTDLLRSHYAHLLIGEIDSSTMVRWADHHSRQPGVSLLQSKFQWQGAKKEIRRLQDAGIDPSKINGPGIYYPKGTPSIVRLIEKLKRLFRHR
jgi:hypothetical protein